MSLYVVKNGNECFMFSVTLTDRSNSSTAATYQMSDMFDSFILAGGVYSGEGTIDVCGTNEINFDSNLPVLANQQQGLFIEYFNLFAGHLDDAVPVEFGKHSADTFTA